MIEIKTKDNGDCIEVISHKGDEGYPGYTRNGIKDYAHRHAYRSCFGNIPNDKCVMHTCDNRSCINPNHLVLGTRKENIKDRDNKRRTAIGSKNGRSKLNEEDALTIYNDKTTPKMVLARKHGVAAKVIRDIKNRKTWRHVTE